MPGKKQVYKHALALYPNNHGLMGFPPIGLEYIAANIKDLVDKVTLIDLRYEKEYRSLEKLNEFIKSEIDLLCISIIWEKGFEDVCDFISLLPHNVTTVVGGYKATLEVDYLFERCPNIDLIVRGEGEEIIRQIVSGISYDEILGLSYRKNGKIIHNNIHLLPDVSAIRFPNRSLRRNEYYIQKEGVRISNRTFDSILSSRGCPYKCKFCTFSLNPLGQKRTYSERPIESIIEELKTITADIVAFSDENFFMNPERSGLICDLIIKNNIKKTFIAQTRIDISKYNSILKKAEKAGFKFLLIGIESPHDRILKQLQKGFTVQDIRTSFAILTQFKFFLLGYFIYGNINETAEEMLYVPKFAKEIGLDFIVLTNLRIEKFSPLKKMVEETPGYYYESANGSVYSKEFGPKELKLILKKNRQAFFDFHQVMHIVFKLLKIKLIRWNDLRDIPKLIHFCIARYKRKWGIASK
ncbi:MAG TPA: hypothetical protein DD381_01055 [Lentisphaeria bacterium]|nr:MAG: hypothetical protein A2X47_05925 [Lentisphaerae bacterium GWF2_38_69]HBM14931.1 hypothetical protein [Lentisphaeria bacterium]